MSSKRRNNYDDAPLHQCDHWLYHEEERERHFKLINVEHEEEVFSDSFPVQVARVSVTGFLPGISANALAEICLHS